MATGLRRKKCDRAAHECATRLSWIEKVCLPFDLLKGWCRPLGNGEAAIARNRPSDRLLFGAKNNAVDLAFNARRAIVERCSAGSDVERHGIADLRHALCLRGDGRNSQHRDES